MSLVNFFKYTHYKVLIKDLILAKKAQSSKFSYSYYSQKMELSESYLKLVISGKRRLNLDKALILAKLFRLTPQQKEFFINLVLENDSNDKALKRYFKNKLSNFSQETMNYEQESKKMTLFESAPLWEIYTLLGKGDFRLDTNLFIEIKKVLNLKLSKTEIEKLVHDLLRMDVVKISNQGILLTQNIIIPHEFNPIKAYQTALRRTLEYLESKNVNIEHDAFDSFCLLLDSNQFEELKVVLEEAKNKIFKIAGGKSESKKIVAYLNMNAFFISNDGD